MLSSITRPITGAHVPTVRVTKETSDPAATEDVMNNVLFRILPLIGADKLIKNMM